MTSKLTKSEFKRMLKPIVKECIQESLLENGLLSSVITEVVKGVASAQTKTIVEDKREIQIREQKEYNYLKQQEQEEAGISYVSRLTETKKKMLDAIGKDAYNGVNLFENTEPISSAPAPGESTAPSSPLSGMNPSDSGVNIDGLLGSVGKNWGRLVKGNK